MTTYVVDGVTLEAILTNASQMSVASTDQGEAHDPHLGGQGYSCANNGSEEYKHFYETAQYVCGLIVYPIMCIIGLTGNLLALIVLNHRDMRTSTNVYLSSLAVSDFIKLLNDLLYFIIVAVAQSDKPLSERIMFSMYPVAHYVFNMSVCVTAWLTVSVAVERYISVCHPARAKQLCTIRRARSVCTCVFVFMSFLAVPSALRYELRTIHDSVLNVTCSSVVQTALGRNRAFMIPYSWVQNSLRGMIPIFILVYLNVRIINELRKERVKGKKLNSRNRITLMLIVVVFMFLVCITPDAIMSTFLGKGYVEEEYHVKGIREITDSLLAVNSAVSFFLYISMSVIFRNTFIKIFCSFSTGNKGKPKKTESIRLNRKEPTQRNHGAVDEEEAGFVRVNGETARTPGQEDGEGDDQEAYL
ncbi:FMRFamide receptor-like [Plakobranchus ocellatus]|uniref:FMRFamide receptor-like n=1 Tax=Plakobranchus ocellatus TaxID=259542 RepID=A0AAV4A2C2_9GAST|nr:FMRFamide receptor-like [Plakobranchus ocellatus]